MRNEHVIRISKIVQSINAWMVKKHFIAPSIVVPVDGGICSQISECLHGQYYAEKGVNVEYDFSWFRTNGKDTNGHYNRPNELFAFFACFPYSHIKEVSRWKAWWYSHFMKSVNPNAEMPDRTDVKRSIYLNPYTNFKSDAWVAEAFARYFPMSRADLSSIPVLDAKNVRKCAVHVRRGDMSYVNFVGYDNPIGYFVDAMKYVQKKYSNVKFFLFSDELEWVQDKLVPFVKGMEVEPVSGNMGYVDLLLAAQCDVIIASQGTMGRMAGLLNLDSELILPSTGDWGAYHVEKYRRVLRFPITY